MSVVIDKSSLTKEQKYRIQKLLHFQPKSSFIASKYGKGEPPILFYQLDGDKVRLPLSAARVLIEVKDRDYQPTSIDFTGTLLDKQQSVVEEAIEALNQHGSVLLHLPTGFGKTVIAAYLACRSGLVCMVLLSFTILIRSWVETFKQFTNARVWVVGEEMVQDPNIIICMEERCGKIPQQLVDNIGVLIVDECHTFYTANRVKALLYCQPRHVIACSATPYTNKIPPDMLTALVGPAKVYRPLDKTFEVTQIKTGIVPQYTLTKQGYPNWSSINKNLADNQQRNDLILQIVKINPHFKVLILVWRSDHALALAELFKANQIVTAVMTSNFKTYSDSRVLIGTINKLGTGFDEKMACPDFQGQRINLLILVGSTKSTTLLEQLAGRVFRSEMPHIVDIVDELPLLNRHWKERLKWYQQHGAVIQ